MEFTDRAREVIERAHAAATRLNPDARIRLVRSGSNLQTLLVDEPEEGDTELAVGSAGVFVAAGLEGILDVEDPHDRIVLRPA